ncbi:extracellular solute-binding protein [Glutamicibacter nicotianae]|uniref:extracellular solute-binding protein n=1 Tax=Glutamicibacter nicotianae TaxID=37929 RepID=UPI0019580D21|nr:extracellular solute-binding protein [Glutamicibacter nicotianae]MBM7766644.1 ABC-type glycerol-3-phosphate transport system substrate-binding protein [Glutamicibacter nicotianae]
MSTSNPTRFKATVKGALAMAGIGALALTGCTPSGAKESSGTPVVTVQVVKDARTKAMAELPWTKDLEAACGCTIEWQETASSSWTQQKQASLAAGEVADVTIGGYGSGDWGDYNSLFLDLAPELGSMPNLAATFEKAPYARVSSEWDGKVFGAPGVNTGLMANSSAHMFINKQWLDELKLPVPETWDELKSTLEAFKSKDPNGNGKADEVPLDFMAPETGGWGWFNPNVLLGSFGLPLSAGGGAGSGMYAQDGKIQNYLTDPSYKEFISYLGELWEAGVISKDAFTHDFSKYISGLKGQGKTATVGMTFWWTPSDAFGSKLADQYIALPALKVDSGSDAPRTWWFNGDSLNYIPNKISVAANVKEKEAALKIVDAFYTSNIGIQARYGSFDVGVKKNGEKDYTVLPPADETKNASDWQFQNSLSDGAPGWFVQPGVKLTLPAEQFEVRVVEEVYEQDIANIDLNSDVIYGGVSFTADEAREYSLNDTGITQTAMSKFAQWVTKGGIDAEWDGYVKDLERNNLKRQIELQQAAYDRYLQVMQEKNVDLNAELNPELTFAENADGTATISNESK